MFHIELLKTLVLHSFKFLIEPTKPIYFFWATSDWPFLCPDLSERSAWGQQIVTPFWLELFSLKVVFVCLFAQLLLLLLLLLILYVLAQIISQFSFGRHTCFGLSQKRPLDFKSKLEFCEKFEFGIRQSTAFVLFGPKGRRVEEGEKKAGDSVDWLIAQ